MRGYKLEENLVDNFNQGLELSLYKWCICIPWGLEEIKMYNFRLLFIPISLCTFKVTDTFKT